jgi:hypothetical protein
MNNRRDAILGYADEQHAFFIRLIENNTVLGESYGLFCDNQNSEAAESIMTTLFLKNLFGSMALSLMILLKGLTQFIEITQRCFQQLFAMTKGLYHHIKPTSSLFLF